MSKYSGRRVDIEIGLEPSRGGGPGATTVKYFLPKVSFSVFDKAPKTKLAASLGAIAVNRGELLEDQWAQGSMEGELRDQAAGLIFLNTLGAVSSAIKETTAYDHSYTFTNTNAHQSIYIKVYDPDKAVLHKNVMLDNLTISVSMGDVVKFNVDWMGRKGVPTSTTKPSKFTEYNFTKNHLKLYAAENVAGLDAAARLSIKTFEITFAKGLAMDSSFGTAEPEDYLNVSQKISGKFNLNYEDETFKNYMKENTMRALRIDMINTDVTIGATSNPRWLADFTNVYFEEWEPDTSNDAIVLQDVNFECHYDEVNNKIWDTFKVTNTKTTYA